MKFGILILSLLLAVPSLATNKCQQIRIAVVDTGLDLTDPRFKTHICHTGHKNFVEDESINDTHGHGTFVAGLIQQYASKSNYCLLIYKYYSESASGSLNLKRESMAFREAIKNGASIINFSGGGGGFNEEEALLIAKNPKVTFVVAAGNEGEDLDVPGNYYFPASLFYKNMHVVGAIDSHGDRSKTSNYSKKIYDTELGENAISFLPNGKMGHMSGTSMATGIFSGKLVDKLSKSCEYK